MKQEYKNLLLKDLCARLPYNTIVQIKNSGIWNLKGVEQDKIDEIGYEVIVWHGKNYPSSKTSFPISICKPYLFPLSSMNEEDKFEFRKLTTDYDNKESMGNFMFRYEELLEELEMIGFFPYEIYDWLNANHFDYRGLIKKGLALDATNLNIY